MRGERVDLTGRSVVRATASVLALFALLAPVSVRAASVQQQPAAELLTTTRAPAEMVTPAPTSTLPGSVASFERTGGIGVSRYWIFVGSAPGQAEFSNQDRGTNLAATAALLPTDGRTVYVRLWPLTAAGWLFKGYTYTTATVSPQPAELVSPAPESTLDASSVDFQWVAGSARGYTRTTTSRFRFNAPEIR